MLRPSGCVGSASAPLELISSSFSLILLSQYNGTAWLFAFKTAF